MAQWLNKRVAIPLLAGCLTCRRIPPVRHDKKRNRIGTGHYTTANVGAFEAGALTAKGTKPHEYRARIAK